jgi:hypothetical protein
MPYHHHVTMIIHPDPQVARAKIVVSGKSSGFYTHYRFVSIISHLVIVHMNGWPTRHVDKINVCLLQARQRLISIGTINCTIQGDLHTRCLMDAHVQWPLHACEDGTIKCTDNSPHHATAHSRPASGGRHRTLPAALQHSIRPPPSLPLAATPSSPARYAQSTCTDTLRNKAGRRQGCTGG